MTTFDELEPTEVEVAPTVAVQFSGHCGCVPDQIKEAMDQAFDTLMASISQYGLVSVGPPRTIYSSCDAEGMDFVVVIPIAPPASELPKDAPVAISTVPGAKGLRFIHRGPYQNLMVTYNRIGEYLRAKGLMKDETDWIKYMPMWEEYPNDPHTTPEADLLTYIFLPMP
jgi:effector-binding domain-containing protein